MYMDIKLTEFSSTKFLDICTRIRYFKIFDWIGDNKYLIFNKRSRLVSRVEINFSFKISRELDRNWTGLLADSQVSKG